MENVTLRNVMKSVDAAFPNEGSVIEILEAVVRRTAAKHYRRIFDEPEFIDWLLRKLMGRSDTTATGSAYSAADFALHYTGSTAGQKILPTVTFILYSPHKSFRAFHRLPTRQRGMSDAELHNHPHRKVEIQSCTTDHSASWVQVLSPTRDIEWYSEYYCYPLERRGYDPTAVPPTMCSLLETLSAALLHGGISEFIPSTSVIENMVSAAKAKLASQRYVPVLGDSRLYWEEMNAFMALRDKMSNDRRCDLPFKEEEAEQLYYAAIAILDSIIQDKR